MRTTDVKSAREHLEEILRNVEGDEVVVVTVNGIPGAKIVPAEPRYKDAAAAIDDWVR